MAVIVLDANVLVVMTSGDPRQEMALRLVEKWIKDRVPLHAPALLPYEVASAYARLVEAGMFPLDRVASAWSAISSLPITYHPLGDVFPVVQQTRAQGRRSAYDAAYLCLARDLDAELWTFDGKLARNAASVQADVHLLG
jgi:predicted nucleic acid-binding protein